MLKSSLVDPGRQRGSWQTIQSEERGLFSSWLQEVAKANPTAIEDLKQFDSDEQRILFCSSLEKVNCFVVQPIFMKKDVEAAKKMKDEGNSSFQKKWYKQAHAIYSISIVKSPGNSDTYAYSIANRSACNYYLGEAKNCIADINIALKSGYPPQLHYKLFERLAKTYVLLKDKPNALKAVRQAKDSLEKQRSKFEKDKYKSAMEKLVKLGIVINNNEEVIQETIELAEEDSEPTTPKLANKSHKKISEFSNLIKVDHNESVGRHVRADKPIKAGDTLVVEEPMDAILYPNRYGTNCNYCFSKLKNVLPCPNCAGVGFCSAECRDIAVESYHKYECKFESLFNGLGCSALDRLALRIITSKSLEFFKKQRHNLHVDNVSSEFKSTYQSVFCLAGLDEHRWPEDIFGRCMMAVCLLKVLKAAGYFPDSTPDVYTDDEVFIGSLLYRHLNVLQFNAHEVYELLRGDKTKIKPCKNNLIALAVYPKSSYFNHSCNPSIARYNIGRKMICKALHPLEKGEEVTDNYGQVFYFKSKPDRQKELDARYWFTCGCQPCQQDWNLLGQNDKPKWKGKADNGQLDFLESLYKVGADFMENGDQVQAKENLVEAVNGMYELVEPSYDPLIRAVDKLRSCYNAEGTVVFSNSVRITNPAEKRPIDDSQFSF